MKHIDTVEIAIHDKIIEKVYSYKFLGVILDAKLC